LRVTDSFYGSPEWKHLLATIIKARGRRCEAPGCGRSNCRIFGDHIVELNDGGARLSEDNIMLLCGSCHVIKTNERKRARQSRGDALSDARLVELQAYLRK
jgi:5-methylcytosine-specific restriction endonuclease McrA